MDLTGAAALGRSLASTSPVVPRVRRRRAPTMVSCISRGAGGLADVAHLRGYEAVPLKAVEAAARDLSKLRAMGLVAGDATKERILAEATELLMQELSQMKDAEDELKKKQKEEKAVMKALKKQQKEANKAAMKCGDESSDSSESECEEEQSMEMSCVATSSMPGMAMSKSAPQVAEPNTVTVLGMDFDKAAMKAMKKREKEQKKAAKKALKMKKEEEKKMSTLNSCMDEDSSSCSSESSDSECEVEMSRCATITAPRAPPASTVSPIIVPQIPDSVAPDAQTSPGPANAMQSTTTTTTSIALVEKPILNRIEVCMGGKCKKAGSLALLGEFEKEVGTDGAVARCKCLGNCGLGPNVRLRSEGSLEKDSPICIGVGLDDVGTIVAGFFGAGVLGI